MTDNEGIFGEPWELLRITAGEGDQRMTVDFNYSPVAGVRGAQVTLNDVRIGHGKQLDLNLTLYVRPDGFIEADVGAGVKGDGA